MSSLFDYPGQDVKCCVCGTFVGKVKEGSRLKKGWAVLCPGCVPEEVGNNDWDDINPDNGTFWEDFGKKFKDVCDKYEGKDGKRSS